MIYIMWMCITPDFHQLKSCISISVEMKWNNKLHLPGLSFMLFPHLLTCECGSHMLKKIEVQDWVCVLELPRRRDHLPIINICHIINTWEWKINIYHIRAIIHFFTLFDITSNITLTKNSAIEGLLLWDDRSFERELMLS